MAVGEEGVGQPLLVLVYRLDDRLFFANATYVRSRTREAIAGAPQPPHWFVFDAEGLSHVDATGTDALTELIDSLRKQSITFVFDRFFDKIARCATLTEAARIWGVSTSAVSKRLARLENRLGVRLVNRSTRRLNLTGEGSRYAAGVTGILAQISDLEESISTEQRALRGRVAVHSTIGLGRAHIAPLLGTFSTLHPEVDIELDLSHLPLNIAGTSFDIAIRVGQLRDSRLRARRLHHNRRVLCAAPSYFDGRSRPTSLADLTDHHCIVIRENETDYAIWRFGNDDDDETAIRVHGSMNSNDGDIATPWCLEGHGLIMRSLWQVAPFIRDGALEQVLPEIPTPTADIFAVYPSVSHPPRRILAALDHLRTGLQERLA